MAIGNVSETLRWRVKHSLQLLVLVTIAQLLQVNNRVEALYDKGSGVLQPTTQKEFDKMVMQDEGVTIVEFFAPCTKRIIVKTNCDQSCAAFLINWIHFIAYIEFLVMYN